MRFNEHFERMEVEILVKFSVFLFISTKMFGFLRKHHCVFNNLVLEYMSILNKEHT